jgi:DNA-binding transcriptional ArsR family regulator
LAHVGECVYTRNTIDAPVPADAFAVLADPTRRRLVEVLHGGERSVGDLVATVDIAQAGVSRHLRILHEAGFVSVRAEGQRRLYTLRPEPFAELDAWMRRYAHDEIARLGRLSKLVDERPKRRKRRK